ncbi:hypothetical protein Tco_0429317 [Tanacetum coccineum]
MLFRSHRLLDVHRYALSCTCHAVSLASLSYSWLIALRSRDVVAVAKTAVLSTANGGTSATRGISNVWGEGGAPTTNLWKKVAAAPSDSWGGALEPMINNPWKVKENPIMTSATASSANRWSVLESEVARTNVTTQAVATNMVSSKNQPHQVY